MKRGQIIVDAIGLMMIIAATFTNISVACLLGVHGRWVGVCLCMVLVCRCLLGFDGRRQGAGCPRMIDAHYKMSIDSYRFSA